MRTSIWPKLLIAAGALLLTGQSCSIRLGTTGRLDGGIFRSDDHGQTWIQKNFIGHQRKQSIYLDDVSTRVIAFDPTASDHLYLGTVYNGIWETMNAAEQWKATSLRSGEYNCLSFDTLNPKVMYTASGAVVLKSVDGGQQWTAIYTESQPDQVVTCVIVNPGIDREVWAITSGGKIILSSDYGQRWTLVAQVPPMNPRLMHFDSNGTLYIFSRANGIWRGDDHGTSWTNITPALQKFGGATDIRAVDINRQGWYIATARGLLKSTNRGVSWIEIPTLVTAGSVPLQNVAVNPLNGQDIFVTAGPRLLHTTNGGATWAVTTLPTGRTPTLLTFDPGKSDRLYFTTFKVKK